RLKDGSRRPPRGAAPSSWLLLAVAVDGGGGLVRHSRRHGRLGLLLGLPGRRRPLGGPDRLGRLWRRRMRGGRRRLGRLVRLALRHSLAVVRLGLELTGRAGL